MASPIIFNGGSLCTVGNNRPVQVSTHSDRCPLGDADSDLIERHLYERYREGDCKSHTLKYLKKCGEKLKTKNNNRLQQEKLRIIWPIRKMYCTREGLLVNNII